jgi:23S rRNA pseudouridine2605 synthase
VKHGKTKHTSPSKADQRRFGLARALSKLGYCSRQQAFQLIRDGKVKLNGTTPRNPEAPVRLRVDRIEVEGRSLRAAEKIYLMLNKRRGVVTTASDEKGRETVYSLLPTDRKWLAPVGRLDMASEGLLLFSNDSQWSARITDPASHLDKTYHVQIAALADDALVRALEDGVKATDDFLQAKKARVLRVAEKNSWLEIVLDEGKNRQIRRMLDALNVEVLRLIRVAIGPLILGDLPKGSHRPLTTKELRTINAALPIRVSL